MNEDSIDQVQKIVEGALLAADKPLSVEKLMAVFGEDERPTSTVIEHVLSRIEAGCEGRGFELKRVASGFRFQVREELSPWVGRLWEEKPQRYSRALLETLALIAYRQPITRGDIEEVRGVTVSTGIIRTLLDREWIRVVGHRDVPGRPAMYATTRSFLDYFNLQSLDELPPLSDVRDLDTISREVEDRLQEELALDEQTQAGDQTPETNE
ncbi:segregation and condensation protein B [Halospina denitrificans]|uniref:Segregation and condensation protein B n=1 Tax=Halospina denitrificans TaxID=332522 RepID=A0A4R7JTI4_9GAMM|nr:SMC-Scp complex subunit ScpB [Halospina denitrificans]TDT41600.1 segregation and condensation protein B [Halospina denitrificans]